MRQTPQRSKTEFMTAAQGIGAEITKTTERLQSLSERAHAFLPQRCACGRAADSWRGHLDPTLAVAKRRSLFDDPAEEINELTDIIKQRIQKLSHEVNDLKVRAWCFRD